MLVADNDIMSVTLWAEVDHHDTHTPFVLIAIQRDPNAPPPAKRVFEIERFTTFANLQLRADTLVKECADHYVATAPLREVCPT
jgi:hypothetical protein